jgi:hypothetical protein
MNYLPIDQQKISVLTGTREAGKAEQVEAQTTANLTDNDIIDPPGADPACPRPAAWSVQFGGPAAVNHQSVVAAGSRRKKRRKNTDSGRIARHRLARSRPGRLQPLRRPHGANANFKRIVRDPPGPAGRGGRSCRLKPPAGKCQKQCGLDGNVFHVEPLRVGWFACSDFLISAMCRAG